MNMLRWNKLLIILFFITLGCAKPVIKVGPGTHLGERSQTYQNKARDKVSELTPSEKKHREDQIINDALDQDWAKMLSECKPAFSKLESSATGLKWTAFGIAITGAIAGAIVVPVLTSSNAAANASWIAGFGGLSGAANTAQETLREQSLTAEYQLRVRESLRREWQEALDAFYAADGPDQRRQALKKATAACIGFAIQNPAIIVDDGLPSSP